MRDGVDSAVICSADMMDVEVRCVDLKTMLHDS